MKNQPTRSQVRRVVSGGQTGVDRGALDAASSCGVPIGGWCPNGRWAEDGRIDDCYPLRETPGADPAQRTVWNVRDSDGTLVLAAGAVSPGTRLTVKEARRIGKPVIVLSVGAGSAVQVRDWLEVHDIGTLNVAGPRESEAPGVYARSRAFVADVLAGAASTW